MKVLPFACLTLLLWILPVFGACNKWNSLMRDRGILSWCKGDNQTFEPGKVYIASVVPNSRGIITITSAGAALGGPAGGQQLHLSRNANGYPNDPGLPYSDNYWIKDPTGAYSLQKDVNGADLISSHPTDGWDLNQMWMFNQRSASNQEGRVTDPATYTGRVVRIASCDKDNPCLSNAGGTLRMVACNPNAENQHWEIRPTSVGPLPGGLLKKMSALHK